ncbi:MAG TPA: hypothetical protein VK997_05165 [Deferrisomatales bacterium]|nr:hypothetical protein [Deferrisomatales bacterium]
MARDAKRTQKAAQKRRQRQQSVQQEKTRRRAQEQGHGSGAVERRMEDLPVDECVISKGWRERGLAHILLARDLGNGHLLVGGYFVDLLCVGLKDCAAIPRVEKDEYANKVKFSIFNDEVEFEPLEPGVARAIVEGAIAYADELGFHPNRRWSEARKVFRGIDPQPDGLEFGRDGKPCLVLRKGDNLQGAQRRLQRKLADGAYQIVDQRGVGEKDG